MSTAAELVPVREGHRFDERRLAEYLAQALPGFAGAMELRQFQGGQSNPTFLVESNGRRWVLRKKPPGKLLPSAHMVEREYRVIRALADTDVPVAPAPLLCEDASVIGTPFYVMEFVDGRVFTDPGLAGLPAAERSAIYDAMNDKLARLHKVDWRGVGLGDFGRPENYVARQIARWSKQYEASKTGDVPEMDRLIAWLPQNIPARDETTLVHGDFRLGQHDLPSERAARRRRARLGAVDARSSAVGSRLQLHALPVAGGPADGARLRRCRPGGAGHSR